MVPWLSSGVSQVDVGAVLTLHVTLHQASAHRSTTILGSDDDADNEQILVAFSVRELASKLAKFYNFSVCNNKTDYKHIVLNTFAKGERSA